jgi:hypothetical protein
MQDPFQSKLQENQAAAAFRRGFNRAQGLG